MQPASSPLHLTSGVATRSFGSIAARPGTEWRRQSPIPTLGEYAAAWLAGISCLVRPNTFEAYTYRLEQHVLPHLGRRRIDEITVDDILGLIGCLREKGLAGGSIRSILTPLSRLFSHAARRDVIAANPISKLDRTERPGTWMREQRVLKREEIGHLLEAAPPQYRTLLATAVFSGLRQSELLGLRWRDVDFVDHVIHVRRAVDRKGRDVPPKTQHSIRDVVLMAALANALQGHRERSRFKGPEDYVFASQAGTPLHRRNVWRQAFEPSFRKAGIERLRWHDLRHTFASLLIGGGANVVFVSRQLGHGSSDVTLRVYAHLFDHAEQAQRTREMLQEMFGKTVVSPAAPSSPGPGTPGSALGYQRGPCTASSSCETS